MGELIELLSGRDPHVPLDRAALELARIEFPGLDARPFLELLDSYAAELGGRAGPDAPGEEYVEQANRLLFGELGFRGNAGDYYNPRNSCLNEALVERSGLPITLSVVYMEIGRRLGRRVLGIGLPGHFLVRYSDGRFSCFLDPFHEGRLLTAGECLELARRVTPAGGPVTAAALEPVSNRQILLRMLNNLRTAYLRRQAYEKAVEVCGVLLEAMPEAAGEYRHRGQLQLQLKRYAPALADLERYLALAPGAEGREEIERRIRAIRKWLAAMN